MCKLLSKDGDEEDEYNAKDSPNTRSNILVLDFEFA